MQWLDHRVWLDAMFRLSFCLSFATCLNIASALYGCFRPSTGPTVNCFFSLASTKSNRVLVWQDMMAGLVLFSVASPRCSVHSVIKSGGYHNKRRKRLCQFRIHV